MLRRLPHMELEMCGGNDPQIPIKYQEYCEEYRSWWTDSKLLTMTLRHNKANRQTNKDYIEWASTNPSLSLGKVNPHFNLYYIEENICSYVLLERLGKEVLNSTLIGKESFWKGWHSIRLSQVGNPTHIHPWQGHKFVSCHCSRHEREQPLPSGLQLLS